MKFDVDLVSLPEIDEIEDQQKIALHSIHGEAVELTINNFAINGVSFFVLWQYGEIPRETIDTVNEKLSAYFCQHVNHSLYF